MIVLKVQVRADKLLPAKLCSVILSYSRKIDDTCVEKLLGDLPAHSLGNLWACFSESTWRM